MKRVIISSGLIIIATFFLAGCGIKKSDKTDVSQPAETSSTEDLKKPITQEDVDQDLKEIDEDINAITADDLNESDLDEANLQ